jgi:hypothetical protein
LQASEVEGGPVPDPEGVGQARRVLGSGQAHRLVEGVAQEVVTGLRLDGDEAVQVLGLKEGLQALGIEAH